MRYYGKSTAAPTAIKMKAPKVNYGGLAEAYEWMPVSKELGFRLAFDWYRANAPALLYGAALTADQLKAQDRAVKAQTLGDGGQTEAEALQAWTTAVRLLETKVYPTKPLPKVDLALEAKAPGRSVASIGAALDALNAAFAGFASYSATAAAGRERSGSSIKIPITELRAMAAQPPLTMVLAEAVTVAKVVSADGAAFMANLPRVLTAVGEWATKSKSKLTGTRQPTSPKSTLPRTNPGSPKSNPALPATDPLGVFRPNTAKAEIANILADGQFHPRSELEAVCTRRGITNGQVNTACGDLTKKGFTIEKRGGQIRLVR